MIEEGLRRENYFGEAVREFARRDGLSNLDLAKRCHIDASTASRVCSGCIRSIHPVSNILKYLPSNEEERALLQQAIAMDLLGRYGAISQLLRIEALRKSESKKEIPIPPRLKKALQAFLRNHDDQLFIFNVVENLAANLRRWRQNDAIKPLAGQGAEPSSLKQAAEKKLKN